MVHATYPSDELDCSIMTALELTVTASVMLPGVSVTLIVEVWPKSTGMSLTWFVPKPLNSTVRSYRPAGNTEASNNRLRSSPRLDEQLP